MAPNRKAYYDDEQLEGPRLERMQLLGVLLLVTLVIGLPLYWMFEPSRQAGAVSGEQERFRWWGEQLFETTANGGFNCSGCHGGMGRRRTPSRIRTRKRSPPSTGTPRPSTPSSTASARKRCVSSSTTADRSRRCRRGVQRAVAR